MEAFDWSRTPLGPIEAWSEELRQAVDRATSAATTPGAPTSAAVLDALFSSAPLGLAIWGRDLRFLRVNDSLAEMNGIPAEQHIGRSPAELLPDLSGLDDLMDRWRQMLEDGIPLFNVEVTGSTHAEGHERSWNEHFFPIRLGSEIVGIGAVV